MIYVTHQVGFTFYVRYKCLFAPPEYDSIALELKPSLENLPPLIIAISGSLHAGKTTLARFLAWYFNISLIETDFYLVPNKDFTYDSPEIERMISVFSS